MILCFDDEVDFARALGLASGLPVQRIARHRFPDGELKLTLPPKLGADHSWQAWLADPDGNRHFDRIVDG